MAAPRPSPQPAPPQPEPPADPDVLVIGGGIAGLFCAYFLRRAGHGVTVLEQATVGDPASCSSGNTGFVANGGVPLAGPAALRHGLRSALRPDDRLALPPTLDRDRLRWSRQLYRAGGEQQVRAAAATMIGLKRHSLQILQELRELSELPSPAGPPGTTGSPAAPGQPRSAFTPTGVLQVYKSADTFAEACRALPQAVANGVRLRVLEPDELRSLEPDTEFDIAGALYNEGGGFLRVPDFLLELSQILTGMGVAVVENCPVLGFEVSGRTVAGVRTGAGELRPREVVVAAGSWSAPLARLLGLRLDLQPVRGYTVTVRRPANSPRGPVLLVEGTIAVRPAGDELRYGGDMALAGVNRKIAPRRVERMLRTVRAHLPALEPTQTLQVWAGLRPCTPDSLPFLGRAPAYDNVTVAAGHGHNGMGLAPAGGQLIAQLLQGSPTAMDLAPFRLDRYTGGGSE